MATKKSTTRHGHRVTKSGAVKVTTTKKGTGVVSKILGKIGK